MLRTRPMFDECVGRAKHRSLSRLEYRYRPWRANAWSEKSRCYGLGRQGHELQMVRCIISPGNLPSAWERSLSLGELQRSCYDESKMIVLSSLCAPKEAIV
jgi:hypothetical protein